jgi:Cys-rich protein (TIGR01571 family)
VYADIVKGLSTKDFVDVPCSNNGESCTYAGNWWGACLLSWVSNMNGISYGFANGNARMAVRTKHGIPGTYCDDFMAGWCCPCCAVAQMARQTGVFKQPTRS